MMEVMKRLIYGGRRRRVRTMMLIFDMLIDSLRIRLEQAITEYSKIALNSG